MTQPKTSRTEFWAIFLLYMMGFALVLLIFDATQNGKWDTILQNWGLSSAQDHTTRQVNSDTGSDAGSAQNKNAQDVLKTLTPELTEKLRTGGYTIFFRHAHRTSHPGGSAFDRLPLLDLEMPDTTFSRGICLTEEGRTEAMIIGQVYKKLDIPVGTIISSPICRAVETAMYAFGRVDYTSAGLGLDGPYTSEEKDIRNKIGEAIFKDIPSAGSNRLIFGHGSTIKKMGVPYIGLQQGDAVVIEHGEDGSLKPVAHLSVKAMLDSLPVNYTLQPYQP